MSYDQVDEPISLEPFNEKWLALYEDERNRLTSYLSQYQPEFAHFGSTAVPGVFAKPTVDILVGIDKIPPPAQFIRDLSLQRYEYLGEAGVPGRHYL